MLGGGALLLTSGEDGVELLLHVERDGELLRDLTRLGGIDAGARGLELEPPPAPVEDLEIGVQAVAGAPRDVVREDRVEVEEVPRAVLAIGARPEGEGGEVGRIARSHRPGLLPDVVAGLHRRRRVALGEPHRLVEGDRARRLLGPEGHGEAYHHQSDHPPHQLPLLATALARAPHLVISGALLRGEHRLDLLPRRRPDRVE